MGKLKCLVVCLLSLLLLVACGDNNSSPTQPNVELVLPSGQNYVANETITIETQTDGHGELTYAWEQLEGPALDFDPSASELSFVAPDVKAYEDFRFKLTVSNSAGLSVESEFSVCITNDFDTLVADIAASDFNDATNPSGFLDKETIDGDGIYKWTRDNAGHYVNITAPIAHFLHVAGQTAAAARGFDEMIVRASQDPADPANVSSADLGVILYAYEATGDSSYLELAQAMWPTVQTAYVFYGTGNRPREILPSNPGLWGFDAYNLLYSLYMAKEYGLEGSDVLWAEEVAKYEGELADRIATDPQVSIFSNLVFDQMGVGSRDDSYAFVPGTDLDVQYTAYALMSQTVEQKAALEYLVDNIYDEIYSEPVAEALAALAQFSVEDAVTLLPAADPVD